MLIRSPTNTFGIDGFRALASLTGWMEPHGLTLEDARRTVIRICRREGGATTGEIVTGFLDQHGLGVEDADRVTELAAFFQFEEKIKRVPGNASRWQAVTPDRPMITALVSIPESEWEAIRPYVYRGSAAWTASDA